MLRRNMVRLLSSCEAGHPMIPQPPRLSSLRPPSRTPAQPPVPRDPGTAFLTRDGQPVRLRPIHEDDVEALRRAFARLTPEQVRLRVFHALTDLPLPAARALCRVDPARCAAFVVTDEDGGEIRGEARVHFDAVTEAAEFAIAIDPAFVGRGVGHALMTRLIATARERGMREVWGDVLVENAPMLDLAERLGFTRRTVAGDPGLLRLSLMLEPEPR